MSWYRHKPNLVEAVRVVAVEDSEVAFDCGDSEAGWVQDACAKEIGEEGGIWVLNEGVRIGTLEGVMRAAAGDYIVRGVRGELYPVKPDIFAATYDAGR